MAALVLFPAPFRASGQRVPRVLALPSAEAIERLRFEGLEAELTDRAPHPRQPIGAVIWQDPPAAVGVPRGTVVQLTVSEGPAEVRVPEVRGLDGDLARRLLFAAGLLVARVDTVRGAAARPPWTEVGGWSEPAEVALATEPAAASRLRRGERIVLRVVARGGGP